MGGGSSSNIVLYDLNQKKVIKKISGHTSYVSYAFYTEGGS